MIGFPTTDPSFQASLENLIASVVNLPSESNIPACLNANSVLNLKLSAAEFGSGLFL